MVWTIGYRISKKYQPAIVKASRIISIFISYIVGTLINKFVRVTRMIQHSGKGTKGGNCIK